MSRNVSARSIFVTRSVLRDPGFTTPYHSTKSGVRSDSSYIHRLSNQSVLTEEESLIRRWTTIVFPCQSGVVDTLRTRPTCASRAKITRMYSAFVSIWQTLAPVRPDARSFRIFWLVCSVPCRQPRRREIVGGGGELEITRHEVERNLHCKVVSPSELLPLPSSSNVGGVARTSCRDTSTVGQVPGSNPAVRRVERQHPA